MPGLNCIYKEFISTEADLNLLFGFFYCEVETPKDIYLGLLPVRYNGGIYSPKGSWTGWYFSEELKFARDSGYKIKVLKGYDFNRESNVFKDYVETLYKIKSNKENMLSVIAITKLLLNSLLGRFGLSINKPVTDIVNTEQFNELLISREIISDLEIDEDTHIVTYYLRLVNKY